MFLVTLGLPVYPVTSIQSLVIQFSYLGGSASFSHRQLSVYLISSIQSSVLGRIMIIRCSQFSDHDSVGQGVVPPSVRLFWRAVPSRTTCTCIVTEDPCRLIDQRVYGGSAYQITYTLIKCADLRGPVDSACMRGVWGVGPSRRRTARRTDSIRFQTFSVYDQY